MNNKFILGIVFILGLVVGAIVGHSFYPSSVAGATLPVGTTNSTPREALIVYSPTAPGATTTSMFNSDANDRVIISAKYECTGIGTSFTAVTGAPLTSAGVFFFMATTSTPNPGTLNNVNYIWNNSLTTTTPSLDYQASTSPGTIPSNITNRIWPAGSYLTVASNATNTATCNIGVDYLPE